MTGLGLCLAGCGNGFEFDPSILLPSGGCLYV